MTTRMFWENEPAEVVAVLDLAALRNEVDPAIVDRIADGVGWGAEAVAQIAEDLAWAERFRTESPGAVLSAFHGRPVHGAFLDRAADEMADAREADALWAAQVLASVTLARRVPA